MSASAWSLLLLQAAHKPRQCNNPENNSERGRRRGLVRSDINRIDAPAKHEHKESKMYDQLISRLIWRA